MERFRFRYGTDKQKDILEIAVGTVNTVEKGEKGLRKQEMLCRWDGGKKAGISTGNGRIVEEWKFSENVHRSLQVEKWKSGRGGSRYSLPLTLAVISFTTV